MAALEVACVPVLSDNYVWLIHDPASGETVALDPGEADPVLAAAGARGWRITAIWNTHWHPDHTGGNARLREVTGAAITGPAAEAARIPTLDHQVTGGDRLTIGAHSAAVIDTPGHTAGHVTFHFADEALLFPGDTLFAMGCGRLFEGTAAQMHANMTRFAALPDDTRVYGAHEYTLANGRFVAATRPDDRAVADRLAAVTADRAEGRPTLPTTIREERATNPFLTAPTVEAFAGLRSAKDGFKG